MIDYAHVSGVVDVPRYLTQKMPKKTIDISEGKKIAADCSRWRVLWAAGDLDGVFNESSNLYKHLRLASSRVKAGFDVLESVRVSGVSSS